MSEEKLLTKLQIWIGFRGSTQRCVDVSCWVDVSKISTGFNKIQHFNPIYTHCSGYQKLLILTINIIIL